MTTMIIAGKDFPEVSPYMTTAISNQRNVSITIPDTDCHVPENDNIITVKWNKVSSLSAKTFVVQTENQFNNIDEALIIFDAHDYIGKFEEFSPENITPHEGRCCILLTTVHSRHIVNIYYMYECVQWYIYNGLAQKSEI